MNRCASLSPDGSPPTAARALVASSVLRAALSLTAVLVLLAGPAVVLFVPGDALAEDPLAKLLARFQTVEALEATFEEEKHIALLAAPLKSRGTLAYARPGTFVRTVLEPAPTGLLVRGGAVEMGTQVSREKLAAQSNPLVAQFVDGFLGLVAGDRARLERGFTLAFKGDAARAWTLTLVPRDERMRALFERLEFAGEGATVQRLTVVETNGDRSVTRFSAARVRKAFAPEESARIFRLP